MTLGESSSVSLGLSAAPPTAAWGDAAASAMLPISTSPTATLSSWWPTAAWGEAISPSWALMCLCGRATGAPTAIEASMSTAAGSGVYSIITAWTPSSAAASVSATTTAIGWPANTASRLASGWNMRMSPLPLMGRSSAVRTATTPGVARAADVSMLSMRACA